MYDVGDIQLTGYRKRVPSTVGSFLANLPELLGAMYLDTRCLVAIAEFRHDRYVQFRVENGGVQAEVVSNRFLRHFADDAALLDDGDEALLREQGWNEPKLVGCPNWRCEVEDASDLLRVAVMIRDVVMRVFRERPDGQVNFQLWVFARPTTNSSNDAA